MRYFLCVLCIVLLSSCGLKPIIADTSFISVRPESVKVEKLGKGTVLFYSGADALHKVDNTGRLNIWINDKPFGQLGPREYAIVQLNEGKYDIKLLHKDVVNMRSTHELFVVDSVKIVKLKPTVTSNRLDVINQLPRKFEKYVQAN